MRESRTGQTGARNAVAVLVALAAALLPTATLAYVGPGAGLSLLGALWGLIAALGLAVAFVVAWPLRRMLRRNRRTVVRPDAGEDQAAAPAPVRSRQA